MDLPPITRAAFYASLGPPRRHGRWTRHAAIIALGLYMREEGRLPPQRHLHNHKYMPSYDTVVALFGSIQRYVTAMPAAWLEVRMPPDTSLQPAPVPDAPRASQAEDVACLRCDRRWASPDKTHLRLCPPCRAAVARDEGDGLWMNNMPVLANGACEWFDTEEL